MGEVQGLVSEFGLLVRDQLQLATLEARQATTTLLTLIALGVGSILLLFSAWLGLMGAGVMFVVERDMVEASTALAIAVGLNLLLGVILLFLLYRYKRRLTFPATTRSLKTLFSKDAYEGPS